MVATLAPRGLHRACRVRLPHAARRYLRSSGDAVSTRYAANPGYSGNPFLCPPPVGLVLVASDEAVNIFGLATRYTARVWLPQVERVAEEVARELVSRAVDTTGIPGPHPRWTELHDEDIPLIEVELRLEYPSLVVEVWDGDRTAPYPPPPGTYLDDHLAAVHERAQHWNWFPLGRGKVIWAELGIRPQRAVRSGRYAGVHDGLLRLDSDRAKGAAR